MAQKKITRIIRPATAEEPPSPCGDSRKGDARVPAIAPRVTRVAAGHCIGDSPRERGERVDVVLACQCGIPNPNTVRDIEYGRDAQLSNVQAVAKAIGLRLELVEEVQAT